MLLTLLLYFPFSMMKLNITNHQKTELCCILLSLLSKPLVGYSGWRIDSHELIIELHLYFSGIVNLWYQQAEYMSFRRNKRSILAIQFSLLLWWSSVPSWEYAKLIMIMNRIPILLQYMALFPHPTHMPKFCNPFTCSH